MRKIFFICLSLILFSINIQAQVYEKTCYYGFTFEVSQNPNWGFGELIITSIEPYSPAEQIGIKVGDIIMEINGKATYLRDNQTIASWMFDNMTLPEVSFTIRNMNTYFKEYNLQRKCTAVNSVNERELSSIFSFYSLENTNHQSFSLPVTIEANKNVDFTDYHTYDFYKEGGNVPAIDAYITAQIEHELKAKGLERNTTDPDIVIQVYYSYEPNPGFTGLEKASAKKTSWRYATDKQKMVQLPFYSLEVKNADAICQYKVEYGFSFYDRKYISTEKLTQIWDCNIKDFLSSNYSLEDYVKLHTPLMLKQFPYTKSKHNPKYVVNFNRYNYTGLYFDADDLITIKDVDFGSPAYKAGIRPGYIIKKLNNKKFDHTKASLTYGYKNFIAETMAYRDQNTRFTDADGYADCMFWNVGFYSEIAKEFNKNQYQTNFSYLYDFEKYVNAKGDNTIRIEAWDGIQMRHFTIIPEIRKSVTVNTL